ncbi:hypothetical protein, partial [Desulfovibrio sp. ZJ200]|uniref:hypothetical protein n=1 Tax=Desulfovibrio sp. ZJ200 TaxID=2709792 RepID=UPI0013ED366D
FQSEIALEHFHFENALLTRKRQPPQRGVHSGENRVFRLNATFDFYKKSKVICSKIPCAQNRAAALPARKNRSFCTQEKQAARRRVVCSTQPGRAACSSCRLYA